MSFYALKHKNFAIHHRHVTAFAGASWYFFTTYTKFLLLLVSCCITGSALLFAPNK